MKAKRNLLSRMYVIFCALIFCCLGTGSCENEPEQGTIIIHVSQGEKNAYCFVDDDPVGICLRGETLHVKVDAGTHELKAYSTYYLVVHARMAGYLCGETSVSISENETYRWEIDSDVDMGYFVDL